ncbi:hypothetical protein QUA81_01055 [Microcoleus sp. F6_B4]
MDSTNQFSQELEQDCAVLQQQLPANPVAEELNELELDAIAGGLTFFDWSKLQWYAPTERIPTEHFVSHIAGKKAG